MQIHKIYCSGRPNQIPEPGSLNTDIYSHSPGGWEPKGKALELVVHGRPHRAHLVPPHVFTQGQSFASHLKVTLSRWIGVTSFNLNYSVWPSSNRSHTEVRASPRHPGGTPAFGPYLRRFGSGHQKQNLQSRVTKRDDFTAGEQDGVEETPVHLHQKGRRQEAGCQWQLPPGVTCSM